MSKEDEIKFDQEQMKIVYEKIADISSQIESILNGLNDESNICENKMKGQYRQGYEEKREGVIEEFIKTNENLETLNEYINNTSKDFANVDMSIEKSLE